MASSLTTLSSQALLSSTYVVSEETAWEFKVGTKISQTGENNTVGKGLQCPAVFSDGEINSLYIHTKPKGEAWSS